MTQFSPLPAWCYLLHADLMLVQVGDGPFGVVSGRLVTAENGEERSPYSELLREGPLHTCPSVSPRSPGHQVTREGAACCPEWPPRVAAIGWIESGNDDSHNNTAAVRAALVHVSDAMLTSHRMLPRQHPAPSTQTLFPEV